jgi:hypothetical protein
MEALTNVASPGIAQGESQAPAAAPAEVAAEVAAPKVEEKPSDEALKLSSRFAALTRKERELIKRERELKSQFDVPEYKTFQEAKKERNPIKLLQAIGMSYQDATDFVLNDQKHTPDQNTRALQEKIDALERSMQDKEAKQEQERYDSIIGKHKSDIRTLVDSNAETYELIAANSAYDTVYEVIEEHFNSNGEILPIEQAAQYVESYLEDEAKKLLGLKKLAPKVPVTQGANEDTTKPDVKTPSRTSPTLTNNLISSQVAQPSDDRWLSDEESKARAAALLRQLRSQQARA